METWLPIDDFPGYEVSSHGRVRNGVTGHVLGIYDNGHGVLQVVMRRDGQNNARAVNRLVAREFMQPEPQGHVPMHIDGNSKNNHVNNLVWRPRWFAVRWTQQMRRTEPRDYRGIKILETGETFSDSLECAKALGGLESEILVTAQLGRGNTYMGNTLVFIDA